MAEQRETYYGVEFQKISAAFKAKEYLKAVEDSAYLLLEVLKKILQDAEEKLEPQDVRKLTDLTEKIGGGVPRARFRLDQMAQLFSQFPLFDKLIEIDRTQDATQRTVLLLLETYDLNKLVDLIEHVQKGLGGKDLGGSDREKEFRFPVQHILLCLAAFLNYRNRLRLTTIEILPSQEEINEIYNNYHGKRMEILQLLGLDPAKDEQVGLKLFDLVKDRGLLFNQSDQTRNISLKVATLVNLLSQIYKNITERADDKNEVAEEILRKAGYNCGLRFGTEMYESIQRQRTTLTDSEKVERWCEFDSDVGFGRFHNYLKFTHDKHKFEVEGDISLSDNFLVVNQVSEESPHLCSFMTGYIQGVLERIFRTRFTVEHNIKECEQGNPINNESFFHIKTDNSQQGNVRN